MSKKSISRKSKRRVISFLKKAINKSNIKKHTLTIIIKSLNEEEHISECIESCLRTIKKIGGEILLVDSLSDDKTAEIARSYGIRIVQIKDKKHRSCGIGPQLGYQLSNSKYVCIIDADMVLQESFIQDAIGLIKGNVAGVGGTIQDAHEKNLISKQANKRKNIQGYVNHLPGIAVYSREALDAVGYMANPYLHSNEESELGYRLINAGYKLVRLPNVAVKHYRDDKSAFQILIDKWKNRYLQGGGEVLRSRIGNKDFWMHLWRQKIYFITMLSWLIIIIAVIINIKSLILIIAAIIIFYLLLSIKKGGFANGAYSLLAWNMTAMQIIVGFITMKRTDMNVPQDRYRVIR